MLLALIVGALVAAVVALAFFVFGAGIQMGGETVAPAIEINATPDSSAAGAIVDDGDATKEGASKDSAAKADAADAGSAGGSAPSGLATAVDRLTGGGDTSASSGTTNSP
jgi:hypothetical protein